MGSAAPVSPVVGLRTFAMAPVYLVVLRLLGRRGRPSIKDSFKKSPVLILFLPHAPWEYYPPYRVASTSWVRHSMSLAFALTRACKPTNKDVPSILEWVS